MTYKMFTNRAQINSEFEIIPDKIKLLGAGIVLDKDGYINYKSKAYITNKVKLTDLPPKIRHLFMKNSTEVETKAQPIVPKAVGKLGKLNDVLFEALQNIIDPEKNTDMSQELKKANTICSVANKIINIADLSLRAEKFRADKMLGYR